MAGVNAFSTVSMAAVLGSTATGVCTETGWPCTDTVASRWPEESTFTALRTSATSFWILSLAFMFLSPFVDARQWVGEGALRGDCAGWVGAQYWRVMSWMRRMAWPRI